MERHPLGHLWADAGQAQNGGDEVVPASHETFGWIFFSLPGKIVMTFLTVGSTSAGASGRPGSSDRAPEAGSSTRGSGARSGAGSDGGTDSSPDAPPASSTTSASSSAGRAARGAVVWAAGDGDASALRQEMAKPC